MFDAEIEENAVIYEVNIRQYSEEGTFNAFTKDIPQLKELGIKHPTKIQQEVSGSVTFQSQ